MHGHSGWVSSPANLISRHDETSPKLNRNRLKIKNSDGINHGSGLCYSGCLCSSASACVRDGSFGTSVVIEDLSSKNMLCTLTRIPCVRFLYSVRIRSRCPHSVVRLGSNHRVRPARPSTEAQAIRVLPRLVDCRAHRRRHWSLLS